MGPQGPISDRVILRQHGSVMIRVYLLEEESSHNLSTVRRWWDSDFRWLDV